LAYNRPVHVWRTVYDSRASVRRHTVPSGFGHSLLAPLATYVFKVLRVSAAVWEHDIEWWPLHDEPSVRVFEVEHGRDRERNAYNGKRLAQACKSRRIVRGELGGLSDFFVPIVARGHVVAVLATGPFATARPTSAGILERWRFLTGRQGHPADPEFASYLAATLALLVLDGRQVAAFEELLGCFAHLMGGEGRADRMMTRVELLQRELEEARVTDRVWEAARAMVDERTPRAAYSAASRGQMHYLGLSRIADHVLVGLTRSRTTSPDVVDEALRRDSFQRASVELARGVGDLLCGQVGDHGVFLLSGVAGPVPTKRRKVLTLSDRVSALAGRFGFALHLGLSAVTRDAPLSRAYQDALGAAESALSHDAKLVDAEPGRGCRAQPLRVLCRELAGVALERPELLGARFDRYLEAAAIHCGHRIDSVRTHLEVAFDRMAEGLEKAGAIDAKSLLAMSEGLDRAADSARTMAELLAAYRRAVADLSGATKGPVAARHDRSMRAALEHTAQHYAEPLRAAAVAKVAGFAPKYFSRLFRQHEGTTFEKYLRGLRVERAQFLLASTELDIERVARLSGFGSSQYFCRVFRRATGLTPLGYRRAAPAPPPDAGISA
jgi:AraC-like DNA-binding protein